MTDHSTKSKGDHMSNKPSLPYDVARCSGVRVAALCNQCLRKTAPGRPGGPQVYISPQVFDAEVGIEQCRNHISATGATHE